MSIENEETGWSYQQSTFQAFYMLESTTIDTEIVESGDIIGAFKDGVCVGWVYADPDGYTTIPIMGDDGSDYSSGYLNNGDVAQLKIYDATYGSILPLIAGDVLPGWANNEIFIIDGEAFANNTFGCTDSSACNFDANATADNGSCWSANEGCECSDGQGSEVDCAGTCNGTLELDDCGVCDGGNADQDCAGVCFGSSEIDGCGVCDDDTSNDDLTCTGCTDECADNYDSGNLFDDGSCTYTIPDIQNFTNTPGECRVTLSWDSYDACGSDLTYQIYDSNNNFIKETSQNSTQILDLDPEIQYCFYAVAFNENGESNPSNLECSITGSECGGFTGMQITASIDGWGFIEETDEYNYIGFSPSATDLFDETLDVVEPPIGPDYWISVYFPHPEWGSALGNNFTQDIRPEDYDFLSQNLQIWEGEVVANMSGNTILQLDFLNGFSEALNGIPKYFKIDDEYYPITDEMNFEFYLFTGVAKSFSIIIGNISPQPLESISSVGEELSVSLAWADNQECCESLSSRYPATSYNIYFDTGEEPLNVSGLSYQHLVEAYETEYCFNITAVNDAGESPSIITCATTSENLPPIANAGPDQSVEVEHDGDINTSSVEVSLLGSGQDPEGSNITYLWTQVSGDEVQIEDYNSSSITFNASNPFGNNPKVYVFELTVTDSYLKGNPPEIASYSHTDLVSAIVSPEPNESPFAPSPVDLIVEGDGFAVNNMTDEDDGNDYNSSTSYWVVPHDGDPNTKEATIILSANSSGDIENDNLNFSWTVTFEAEEFTDLNGDGVYSPIEPFIDSNGNGVWDSGIEEINDENILVVNREEGFYEVVLTVTDAYGATATSEIVIGVEAEANEAPTALAGADQEWFMPNNQDLKDIVIDDNSGADSDNDMLLFSWNIDGYDSIGDSSGDFPALLQSLPEGEHTFTFTTTDSYGASASDDVVISIFNEPASAAVTNVSTSQGLYYVEITFDEGILEQDDRYTGALDNSVGYDIFRDGDLLATINDEGESSFYYLDNGINPSTTYTYDVQSFNSDDRRGDAVAVSGTTGDRPTVEVVSPNGAEIWSVGDAYPVEISTTDKDYISDIEVLYSADGGQTWTSSGSIDSNGESTTITSDGVEINYDAKVKVVVTDVGDYFGDSKNSNEDASDNSFTLAAHTLSKNYWTGWHLFGAPLIPYSNNASDFMTTVGNFGIDWIMFDDQGQYQNLEISLGEGFYLALNDNATIIAEGDPITSANIDLADFELQKGWNLISHTLVSIVQKNQLIVIDEEQDYTWDDAVHWGLLSPTLYSWNEDSYESLLELSPWSAFWVHASRDLTVEVRPHLPLNESARISDSGWMLELQANPTDGVSGGDFIQIGLKDGASNTFVYGEDEYDHPNPGIDSYVDLYFDKNDWIGSVDHRGIMVESPYFSSDMRSSLDDVQVWDIKGNLNNVLGEVELSWTMDAIDRDVHLLVSGEAFNMSEVSSVVVSSMDDVMIVAGDLSTYLAPSDFELSAAYPNPFNPSTSLDLSLNESGHVNIYVYNVLGQIVSTLADSYMDAGYHTFTWNADNVPSGMYLVRVEAGSNVETQKIMLLK